MNTPVPLYDDENHHRGDALPRFTIRSISVNGSPVFISPEARMDSCNEIIPEPEKPESPIAKYVRSVMRSQDAAEHAAMDAALLGKECPHDCIHEPCLKLRELSASVISEGRKALMHKWKWPVCCESNMALGAVKIRMESEKHDYALMRCVHGCGTVRAMNIILPESVRKVCAPGSRFDAHP